MKTVVPKTSVPNNRFSNIIQLTLHDTNSDKSESDELRTVEISRSEHSLNEKCQYRTLDVHYFTQDKSRNTELLAWHQSRNYRSPLWQL